MYAPMWAEFCYDILMLGKSPIKWRQRPDMNIAVDWDVKHQFKQTNEFCCSINRGNATKAVDWNVKLPTDHLITG